MERGRVRGRGREGRGSDEEIGMKRGGGEFTSKSQLYYQDMDDLFTYQFSIESPTGPYGCFRLFRFLLYVSIHE